jgi:predicted regulator of amino acid metabolism with ACT domain
MIHSQLNLLNEVPKPYKYIIDTSSILSQKPNEPNRRIVNKSMWEYIDSLISEQKIINCSEIIEEIKDDDLAEWWRNLGGVIISVDDDIQNNVVKVVTQKPDIIDFKQVKSSGDAFLIATAMKYNLIIITEESKASSKKIPKVAKSLEISSINIIELCEKEDKQF